MKRYVVAMPFERRSSFERLPSPEPDKLEPEKLVNPLAPAPRPKPTGPPPAPQPLPPLPVVPITPRPGSAFGQNPTGP